jgi:hypothetical protein
LKNLIFIIFLFFGVVCQSQTLTVTSDKNPVAIGEQITLKFTINANAKEFKAPKFSGLRLLNGPISSSSSKLLGVHN